MRSQRAEHLLYKALQELQILRAERSRYGRAAEQEIAIIGLACRTPAGVNTPEDYWSLLTEGEDAIRPFPLRWNSGSSLAQAGGAIDGVELFDPGFFQISPREAKAMAPQQRLVLELAWEALEGAGIVPKELEGTRTGTYIGALESDYHGLDSDEDSLGYRGLGRALSVISGRVSYFLDLKGPALTVDTACSASLVALHLACAGLRQNECDLALAGGVQVMCTPATFIESTHQRVLASDGRCKAFSVLADGTGWSEGAGMMVLKRLSEAQKDGDPILGVIKGSAVNQDGRSQGLTAPNGPSQEQVIHRALSTAGLRPSDIDAIEAHGTGTNLGDPIEARALVGVFRDHPIYLGSSKSNIGHAQAAAGVLGVIKMVLALEKQTLPRTLHCEQPSFHIDWEGSGLELLQQNHPWPQISGRPRRAGISSFGISGTNAHLVLEEAATEARSLPTRSTQDTETFKGPLLVSGKTAGALKDNARRLQEFLKEHGELRRVDVAYSLARTRTAFEYRWSGLDDGELSRSGSQTVLNRPGGLGVLFGGQGSQRSLMGLSLLGQPGLEVFTRSFNRLLDLCEGHLPLREILESGDELRETEKTQPALFCLEVALYRQWEAWGVKPEILIGHSIGELAAAHVAGVMTLGEAVQLVCARGRLMTELARPGGAMAALRLSEGKVLQILEGLGLELEIASVNSEHHTVVSGEKEAIEELLGQCGEKAKYLRVSHAFHSRHMEPMLESFREIASQFDYGKPTIPLVSTLTGERLETIDADYWVKQLRHTVRFGKATKLVQELGVTTFLECGPGASLSPLVDNGISSLSRKEDEFLALMRAVGKLWESHQELDWEVFFAPFEPRVVELPTYAFQRERYWPVPLAEEETVLRWCYEHRWQPADKASKAQDYEELWLVVPETLGEKLARASGQDCRVLSFEEVLDEELPARTCVVYSPEPGGSWSRSLEQLLELSQKLKAQPFEGSLWVLTPQTISLGESDPPGSGLLQSLWGFGRSLSLEEPRLLGGLVDLPSEVTTEELETVWPYLLQETPCEDELVLREGNLWSRRLQRTELDEGKTWRPEGKILIAGGSGYLGQLLTNWLKKQGAEDLLLVSRTGLFPCDVTDEAAVRSLLASNEDIKHIFHLAGVESRGRLQELSKAELRRVMAAKVEGAWNLHRVSQEMGLPLESFVMYGSIAGFWGSGGQLGYSAANAALTGLMEVRRSLGLAGTVVHWGPWAKGGMVSPERAEYLRRRGILEMEPEQAHRALFKILASDLFSIVVSKMDWKPFAESLSSARPRPLLSEISMISPADYSQPVVDSTSKITDELARLEEDERLPWLVEFVRREVAEVLGLGSVEKIPPERPIQELGLDSLMAIELRKRLVGKSELRLPTTLVYDHPEPEAVARFLLEKMFGFRRWSNDEVHRKLRSVSIEALRESGILEAFMAIPEGLVEEADELRQQISEAGEDELMGLAERLLGDRSTLSSE